MSLQPSELIPIPPYIHRVWFGSDLPNTYKTNLIHCVLINRSHYQTILWIDEEHLVFSELRNLENFCRNFEIELRNIRNYPNLSNYKWITFELNLALQSTTSAEYNTKINFVRASDLARIAILYEFGGVYTDTDAISKTALPQLSSPYGFFCKHTGYYGRNKREVLNRRLILPNYTNLIHYDFIAASAKNIILGYATSSSDFDYIMYSLKCDYANWMLIQNDLFQLNLTLILTGSALRVAINHFTVDQLIFAKEAAQLFFNDTPYFNYTNDKSYFAYQLGEHATHVMSIKQKQLLNQFYRQIEHERQTYFLVPKHKLAYASLFETKNLDLRPSYSPRYIPIKKDFIALQACLSSGAILCGQYLNWPLFASFMFATSLLFLSYISYFTHQRSLTLSSDHQENGFVLPRCHKNRNLYH